ncbi:MAG: hypothetical protein PHP45_00290 [Elusimicrobiales bacterium]|nr:hypothetical protein [Elusimicrobiales bacterium]
MNTDTTTIKNSIDNMVNFYSEIQGFIRALDVLMLDARKWKLNGKNKVEVIDTEISRPINNWIALAFGRDYMGKQALFTTSIILSGDWGKSIDEPLFLSTYYQFVEKMRRPREQDWIGTSPHNYFLTEIEPEKKTFHIYTAKELFTSANKKRLMNDGGYEKEEFLYVDVMKFMACPLLELKNTNDITERILKPMGIL